MVENNYLLLSEEPSKPYIEIRRIVGIRRASLVFPAPGPRLAEIVFENLRSRPHVFLLREYEDPTSQKEVLERSWPALFEAMLEGWVTDEEFWPKDRTLEMFRKWFEIQMCSIVQDLDSDTPLEVI